VLAEAERSALPTHGSPQGVAGAQAVAAAVFLARTGSSKDEVRRYVETTFGYDCSTPVDDIRPAYRFDVSCAGSVPQALRCAFEADGVETAIRLAVSLGGDADTQACMAGAVAEAFHGALPDELATATLARLDDRLRSVIERFYEKISSR